MEDWKCSSVFSLGSPFGQSQLSRSHYHPSSPHRTLPQQGRKVMKPGQCQLPAPSFVSAPPLASIAAPRPTDQPAAQGEAPDTGPASPLGESWPSTESSSLMTPEGEAGESLASREMFRTDSGWSGSPHVDPAESSIIAKYIQRFRHGKPLSRQEREHAAVGMGTEGSEFWWLKSSPPNSSTPTEETHPHHPDTRSLATEGRESTCYSARQGGHLPVSTSLHNIPSLSLRKTGLSSGGERSDVSQLEPLDLETIHLQKRANHLLQRSESSCSGLVPISSDGVGSPSSSDHVDEVLGCPVSVPLTVPSDGDKDVKHFSTRPDGPSPSCKPSFSTRPEDDILYLWRLQRKMEAARVSSWALLAQRKSHSPPIHLGRQITRSDGDMKKDKSVVTGSYPEGGWRESETSTRSPQHSPGNKAGTGATCPVPILSRAVCLSENWTCLQAGTGGQRCDPQAAEREPAQRGRDDSGLTHGLSSAIEGRRSVDCPCRQHSTGEGRDDSGLTHGLSSAIEGRRSADGYYRQCGMNGGRTSEAVSGDKEQGLEPLPEVCGRDCPQRGRRAHHWGQREVGWSSGLEESSSQPPVYLQPQNVRQVRPRQQDSHPFTGSSGSDTEQQSSEGEHDNASPENSSARGQHQGKPAPSHRSQHVNVQQVLGQVVSERMFPRSKPNHQIRSKPNTVGRARGHRLPPSSVTETRQTPETVTKLLEEAEESDGMEFEEDVLLRVLRQQRDWVLQQLRWCLS
ncbi:proline and serine-rich protein 3 isoform X3 [Chiloscyllium punctatum]|uniref:proline and serine-rich protein 3 isoform X3 n=1 Tax=Chiloscyllium punctatum TaxID=137246 RepID=UPI003B63AD9E